MKLNRLETHDRLVHFVKDQSQTIWQGAEECLKKNPDSLRMQEKSPYIYVFAHPRTADDGVTKRLLWQPRLTRPKSQSNSYLFRAISKTDLIEVCWLIPPRELWKQFRKENLTNEPTVIWSIDQFIHNRKNLESPHPEDWNDEQVKNIWKSILETSKQQNEGVSLTSEETKFPFPCHPA